MGFGRSTSDSGSCNATTPRRPAPGGPETTAARPAGWPPKPRTGEGAWTVASSRPPLGGRAALLVLRDARTGAGRQPADDAPRQDRCPCSFRVDVASAAADL